MPWPGHSECSLIQRGEIMNLLIVDDQISVLDGILKGVDFASLKIENVYTATNVSDAKDIIKSNDIQILLSDIEMPGENGLSLNRWIAENYPVNCQNPTDFPCIFRLRKRKHETRMF